MYTEIYVNFRMIDNVPENVVNLIKVMTGEIENNESIEKPNHPLFKTTRWWFLFNSHSFYHIPYTVVNFKKNDISRNWYLTARSDLKDYDNEVELFFDWIKQYIDSRGDNKTFIGYSRHEESDEPILYYA